MKAPVLLRYDPRDISCLFALDEKGRQERKRSTGQLVGKRALKQREILEKAEGATRKVRRNHHRMSDAGRQTAPHKKTTAPSETVNFDEDSPGYDIEFWGE